MLPLLWKTIAKLRAQTLPPWQGGDRVLLMLGTGGLKTSLRGCIVDFRGSGKFQLLPSPVSNRATSYKSEKSISGRETLAGLNDSPCVSCDFVSDVAEGGLTHPGVRSSCSSFWCLFFEQGIGKSELSLERRSLGTRLKLTFWMRGLRASLNTNERFQAKKSGRAASTQSKLGRQTGQPCQGALCTFYQKVEITDLNAANILIYSLCSGHGFLLKKADIQ